MKAKEWSECPVMRFPEVTVGKFGREGSLVLESGMEAQVRRRENREYQ